MPSYIDRVTVRGFRSIREINDLELRPLNILVGANGSGKSNFIGVFDFLRSIRDGRLQNYVVKAGGADKVLHFGSKVTAEIRLELSFIEGVNSYRLTLAKNEEDSLYPFKEEACFLGPGHKKPYLARLPTLNRGLEAGISSGQLEKTAAWVRKRLGSFRIYHVHDTSSSSPMRTTADLDDNQYLRPDGSNLAAYLFFLKKMEPASYLLITRTIQRVAPFFEDFSLGPSRLNEKTIKLEWKHKNSETYFDASTLSDGSLRFILLATLFLQPSQFLPHLILVDEPELGLHPYAIEILAAMARQASKSTQVLIATQSSQLLDNFESEDVLVADRVSGGTRIRRLTYHELAPWLEDYSLGQLWEKNEFAGRPSAE